MKNTCIWLSHHPRLQSKNPGRVPPHWPLAGPLSCPLSPPPVWLPVFSGRPSHQPLDTAIAEELSQGPVPLPPSHSTHHLERQICPHENLRTNAHSSHICDSSDWTASRRLSMAERLAIVANFWRTQPLGWILRAILSEKIQSHKTHTV